MWRVFWRDFLAMFAVVGLLALVLTVVPLRAHDFYDPWCCNGEDCKPYHGVVETRPDGFYLPEFDVTIPYKDARGTMEYAETAGTRYDVPPDAAGTQYYACIMPWEPTKVRCFGARPGGV